MKKFEFWTIAYRNRTNNESIIDNIDAQFKIISNSWRYWRADPFIVAYGERTYIFAELYDRILRRGVIGCAELTDSGCKKWNIVLKEPFHLSYPFVFESDGTFYMIPESYVSNEIRLYRAVDFPLKWEFVSTLTEICAVDSTLIESDGERYLITQILDEKSDKLAIFKMDDKFSLSNMSIVPNLPADNLRPAGKAFLYNGMLLRPSQDCSESYGCALNIAKITKIEDGKYEEQIEKKIYPNQIRTDESRQYSGIHTYNSTDEFEVIDLKDYENDYLFPIMRIIWGVTRRIKKLVKK